MRCVAKRRAQDKKGGFHDWTYDFTKNLYIRVSVSERLGVLRGFINSALC